MNPSTAVKNFVPCARGMRIEDVLIMSFMVKYNGNLIVYVPFIEFTV
jgi:hypothetical protein